MTYTVLDSMFKIHIRYNDCRFMRSVNASPYFTFTPMGKLVSIYARPSGTYPLHKMPPHCNNILNACRKSVAVYSEKKMKL